MESLSVCVYIYIYMYVCMKKDDEEIKVCFKDLYRYFMYLLVFH